MRRRKNKGACIYLKFGNMSRLSKKPILLVSGVKAKEEGGFFVVTGPKGERRVRIIPFVKISTNGDAISVSTDKNIKQARMNVGTMWSLVANAVTGVTEGFGKILEINGTGYRAEMDGKTLVLHLGFVNPIRYEIPEGVEVSAKKNQITVNGIDKYLVGRVAAKIRSFRKPEPYKGKGIKYHDEIIIRKAGKKAAAVGAVGGV